MQRHTLRNHLQLTLREAEPRDAERVLAYMAQVVSESENTALSPGETVATVEQEAALFQEAAASPISLFLLAEVDNEIAGMLSFHPEKRQRIRHSGEFGITVQRKYWNLGIGAHLLGYLVDRATASKVIRKINLRVRVDNLPAIHLYEKYGFVVEGRITRSLYVRGEFIDSYIMGLQIDPPEA